MAAVKTPPLELPRREAELKPTARSTILAAVMAEIRRVPMAALRLHDRAMHRTGANLSTAPKRVGNLL